MSPADTSQRVIDARRRDAANSERFAIRRQLRVMSATEHELSAEMDALLARQQQVKAELESNYRAQHWRKDPERNWAWRDGTPASSAVRSRRERPAGSRSPSAGRRSVRRPASPVLGTPSATR